MPVLQTGTRLKKVHYWMGIIGFVVFLGTGQYMLWVYHGLRGLDALPRMLFRSAHIYLLLSSFINLAFGLHLTRFADRGRRLQIIGSFLVLIAPALMLAAFFIEPGLADFERPFAGPGIYALAAGMLLHLIAFIRQKKRDWRFRG